MKESLLCRVLVFLADTPKSAGKVKANDIFVSVIKLNQTVRSTTAPLITA